MNDNEARLKIHGAITEVLVAMAIEDNATDEEADALEEEMTELADVIMEDLGVEVLSVNEDKSITVVLRLFSDEEVNETA
jgi:transposase